MSNVISLVEKRAEPNASVLDNLRHVLERAERGEMVNVAIAYVTTDGATGEGWAAGPHSGALLSAVTILQHRLCMSHVNRSEPVDDAPN